MMDLSTNYMGLNLNNPLVASPSPLCEDIDNIRDLVRDVGTRVGIPVAVKLSPYFSSIPHMARRLDQAETNALVLFNRFYQPDLDLENLEVVPNLVLSTSHELRLRLRWVAILYGQVRADMAVTGGVHTAEDVVKTMMVGARAAMMTSALLKNGIQHLARVLNDLVSWMERHEYGSIRQMQGTMSHPSVAEPAAFERANYMKVLRSYTTSARASGRMGTASTQGNVCSPSV